MLTKDGTLNTDLDSYPPIRFTTIPRNWTLQPVSLRCCIGRTFTWTYL